MKKYKGRNVNWYFKLDMEIVHFDWKFKLKIVLETGIENWHWRLKSEIENWKSKLKMNVEVENWNCQLKLKWKLKLKIEILKF